MRTTLRRLRAHHRDLHVKAFVVLLAMAFNTGASAAPASDFASAIDRFLASRARAGLFSGTVAVNHKGRLVFVRGYGLANREARVRTTAATPFWLTSMSTQLTAVAIFQLRDQGKLELDASVCTVLPRCPRSWRPMTIRMTMLHKTGLPSLDQDWSSQRAMPLAQRIAQLRRRRLVFLPGHGHDRNYVGWWLAGYLVERASGVRYTSYLRRFVFDPLGIRTARSFTGACGSTRPYVRKRGGGFERVTFRQRLTVMPDPAMGFCMTITDYGRFDAGLPDILSERSLAEIFGPQPSRSSWNYGWIRTTPGRIRMPDAPQTKNVWFAVGGHGWAAGYYTIVERFPTEHISVMLFTNDGANGRAFPYANRIADIALRRLSG